MNICIVCNHPTLDLSMESIAKLDAPSTVDPNDNSPSNWKGPKFCPSCHLVQSKPSYHERSLTIDRMNHATKVPATEADHLEPLLAQIKSIMEKKPSEKHFVEIGYGKGSLIEMIKDQPWDISAMDPAGESLGQSYQDVQFSNKPFKDFSVREITEKFGKARLAAAINTLSFIVEPHSFMRALKTALNKGGMMLIQEPWLPLLLNEDHEDPNLYKRYWYFSLSSLNYMVASHDLIVIDVSESEVNKGDVCVLVGKKGEHYPKPSVQSWLDKEKLAGANDPKQWAQWLNPAANSGLLYPFAQDEAEEATTES